MNNHETGSGKIEAEEVHSGPADYGFSAPDAVDGTPGDTASPARLGIAELIYGVIFSPVSTFRSIAPEPPLFHSFVVFAAVVILTALVNSLVPPDFSGVGAQYAAVISQAGPYLGLIGALMSFAGWFLQAGIYQLFAELLGGKGRALGVLTVLALADLPRVLVIPFQVLAHFSPGSFLATFLTVAVNILVLVWWLVLVTIGLREIQGYTTFRAAATIGLPVVLLFFAVLVITAAFIGIAAPLLD